MSLTLPSPSPQLISIHSFSLFSFLWAVGQLTKLASYHSYPSNHMRDLRIRISLSFAYCTLNNLLTCPYFYLSHLQSLVLFVIPFSHFRQFGSYLGYLLVELTQSLLPQSLFQQNTQISVGEPATSNTLLLSHTVGTKKNSEPLLKNIPISGVVRPIQTNHFLVVLVTEISMLLYLSLQELIHCCLSTDTTLLTFPTHTYTHTPMKHEESNESSLERIFKADQFTWIVLPTLEQNTFCFQNSAKMYIVHSDTLYSHMWEDRRLAEQWFIKAVQLQIRQSIKSLSDHVQSIQNTK